MMNKNSFARFAVAAANYATGQVSSKPRSAAERMRTIETLDRILERVRQKTRERWKERSR